MSAGSQPLVDLPFRPDALILDFDGVVIDSEPLHARALRHAADLLGYTLPPSGPASWYVGLADRDAFKKICELSNREPTSAAFAELSQHKWDFARRAIGAGEIDLYPGTVALAHAAHAAGTPVAICSGARRREIEHIIAVKGLAPLIRLIVSADDVTNTKPSPEPYSKTAQSLGFAPERCLTLEDSDVGVASATAAGIFTIAVGHTLPRERLTAADLYVENSRQLQWPR
jgi:beta-phosphoglucomutase